MMDTKSSTTIPKSRLSKRASISLALASAVILSAAASVAAQEKSKGVYRIPYDDGVTVKVTNDHLKHNPPGRIDMHGDGGSKPYKIVAAADGRIRFIVDNFSKQIDSSSGEPCTNNYVWIEHSNGEWTKYSHMESKLKKVLH
jgi:murein DD-endopeptidase MepM/ murein hydrolase activator NlpD